VSTKIELQKEQETATLAFDETFTAGSQIKLHCIFTGTHNDKMAGFYRSGYTCKVDGVKK
jgi:aminopeptidase 2